ncbi:uncharacterized protein VTP21DRAFT_9930 [Calcarisporiella thermophila]|uniref:uncharacterized protein n=1 Tax=Calcarisporiella thermophila TaxID=911321 RepID=UPI003742AA65
MGRLIKALAVALFILFISGTSQVYVLWPYSEWGLKSFALYLSFNALVILLYVNFYLTYITPSGHPPAQWNPHWTETISLATPRRKFRYCRTCNSFKPPRTHHCQHCKKCILKMDHHCQLIDNCIGYRNLGHFVRFLFYAEVSSVYCLVLMGASLYDTLTGINNPMNPRIPTSTALLFSALNFALTLFTSLLAGMFLISQLFCVLSNTTTIESWEKAKVDKLIRSKSIPPTKYPFDLGIYRNLCSLLGPSPLFWLFPQPMLGDGLAFGYVDGTDPYGWPPRNPEDPSPSWRVYREDGESSDDEEEREVLDSEHGPISVVVVPENGFGLRKGREGRANDG